MAFQRLRKHSLIGCLVAATIVVASVSRCVADRPEHGRENYVVDFSSKKTKLLVPRLPFLTQFGNFTCSVWFRIDGDPVSQSHTLFEYADGSSNRFGFRVVTGSGGGRVSAIRYDGSYAAVRSNRAGFNLGQWTHAVMTCAGGKLKLFVNGVDVSEPSQEAALGLSKQIGEQEVGSVTSEHRQGDTRFYERVLSAEEIKTLYEGGRNDHRKLPSSPADYVARWHPSGMTSKVVPDLSPNGYDLRFSHDDKRAFRIDQPLLDTGIRKVFAVGNSLTADSAASVLAPQSDWVINPGQSMIFHAATPLFSTHASSYLWGKALESEEYDVLMLQPFPTRPAQRIEVEVAAMQRLIDKQPAAIIIVHEGFAPASSVRSRSQIEAADDGKFSYSRACFEEMLRQLREANPGRDIRLSRTNEAVHLVGADIASGMAKGVTGIGLTFGSTELYRDNLHINYTLGRYLIHHCVRRAMGINQKRRDFPFINHPAYGSADLETLDYLDTVVDRVFAEPN